MCDAPSRCERITLGMKNQGNQEGRFVSEAKTEPSVGHNEKCQPLESGVHCTQP
jgi:hypothetical protein